MHAHTHPPSVACSHPRSVLQGRARCLCYQGFPQGPSCCQGNGSSWGRALALCRHLVRAIGVLPAPSICCWYRFLVSGSLRQCGGHGASSEPPTALSGAYCLEGAGCSLSHRQWETSVLTLAASACLRGQAGSVHPPRNEPRAWSPAAEVSPRRAEPLTHQGDEGICRFHSH